MKVGSVKDTGVGGEGRWCQKYNGGTVGSRDWMFRVGDRNGHVP